MGNRRGYKQHRAKPLTGNQLRAAYLHTYIKYQLLNIPITHPENIPLFTHQAAQPPKDKGKDIVLNQWTRVSQNTHTRTALQPITDTSK